MSECTITKRVVKVAAICVAICLAIVACKRRQVEESPVIATAYDYNLRLSDIEGLVPAGLSSDDSAALVEAYVEQWLRSMVLLNKAEKNIKDDFSSELAQYRNSLLTYAYEQRIVNNMLDTVVRPDQIETYYNQHPTQFPLSSAVVKAVWLKVPAHSPEEKKLRPIVTKAEFTEKQVMELQKLSERHSLSGHIDADEWMPFYTLQKELPFPTLSSEETYLRQHRYDILSADSCNIFLRIVDYRLPGAASPLEMQQNNIRSIILAHRKREILSHLTTELMSQAEEGGHIKRISTQH